MENNHGHMGQKGMKLVSHVLNGIVLAIIFGLIFGIFVMLLWNWLMPTIFGLTTINYWQGAGLVLMMRLLFGTIGHGAKYHNYGKHHGLNVRNHGRCDLPNYSEWWQDEGKQHFQAYTERVKGRGGNDNGS
ncbi:MAG: hypothetical protein H6Q71_44 [Firmicutes bacterium]|nr:hypothetical protein [Bacillota bacterium]